MHQPRVRSPLRRVDMRRKRERPAHAHEESFQDQGRAPHEDDSEHFTPQRTHQDKEFISRTFVHV